MEVTTEARDAAPVQSNDVQDPAVNAQDGDAVVESSTEDTVAYSTFNRNMSKLKKTEAEKQELETKIKNLELEKLEAADKKDEMIIELRKQLNETQELHKKDHASFAYKSVTDQIEREALKMGCIDTDALVRLSALEELEVDDNFNVQPDSIKRLLEDAKKSKKYLFDRPGPKVRDAVPSAGATSGAKTNDKLTLDELKDRLRSLG